MASTATGRLHTSHVDTDNLADVTGDVLWRESDQLEVHRASHVAADRTRFMRRLFTVFDSVSWSVDSGPPPTGLVGRSLTHICASFASDGSASTSLGVIYVIGSSFHQIPALDIQSLDIESQRHETPLVSNAGAGSTDQTQRSRMGRVPVARETVPPETNRPSSDSPSSSDAASWRWVHLVAHSPADTRQIAHNLALFSVNSMLPPMSWSPLASSATPSIFAMSPAPISSCIPIPPITASSCSARTSSIGHGESLSCRLRRIGEGWKGVEEMALVCRREDPRIIRGRLARNTVNEVVIGSKMDGTVQMRLAGVPGYQGCLEGPFLWCSDSALAEVE
ncbi:hypothetical protein C8F01DRAFT_1261889 [Mycena amicta]|nr:hypothetical protein C8F01DRAFT_1261889 [Mycena amicta]